jgi:tetratricopeptide (TPR) repeat protein
MVRFILLAIVLVAAIASALAATEADRRKCSSGTQNPEDRIGACTALIAEAATPASVRAMAYRNRGIAYTNKKLLELAVFDLDEAIKLNAQDVNAWGNRGRALLQMGKYDRAIADYTEVARLNPRHERAYNERGLARLRKGDLDAALADFQKTLDINPQNAYARNNVGITYAKQGKLDLAIVAYSELIALDPAYLLAYANRGRAYEERGDIDLAIRDYRQVGEREARPQVDDDQKAKTGAKKRLERLTAAAGEGKAGAKAPVERRVALVIGNGKYEHAPPLANPANDAMAMAAALRQLGFAEVRELYDADLSKLGNALKTFGDLATAADWAIIYYAGHGIEVAGVNYLIPVDARLEQMAHVEDEAVPLTRVLGKVTAASKMQLVILDACRNNPFAAKMRSSGRATRSIGSGLASIEPESGMLVAYASRDGTTAIDGTGGNSPYAEALVRYITEPGLEISLLFRKVRDEVYTKTARQQEPFTYGSLPAQPFYFRR